MHNVILIIALVWIFFVFLMLRILADARKFDLFMGKRLLQQGGNQRGTNLSEATMRRRPALKRKKYHTKARANRGRRENPSDYQWYPHSAS